MTDVMMVLGMHRSGTSSVAGVLTKLGCALPKSLMPANAGNVRGYFESTAFMMFHDELLHSAGSVWSDWRPFNTSWLISPVAAGFRQRAKELFEEEFGDRPFPILKDPRICRFAPFWLDVLKDQGATPRAVLPIRPPLEVAQSLRAIHQLPVQHGLLLWLRHVLDAEYNSRSVERSIFTWGEFRVDWRRVCDQIASETGLAWPRLSDRVAREIDAFLASELVHYNVQQHDTTEWTSRAYSALVELAQNRFSNSAQAELDNIRLLLDEASATFGRLLIDTEVDLEATRIERNGLRSAQELQATELDAARRELEVKATELDATRRELEVKATELDATRRELEVKATELDATRRELEAHVSELSTKLQQLGLDLDDNVKLRTELAEALLEKERQADAVSLAVAGRDALTERVMSLETALREAVTNKSELTEALHTVSVERDHVLELYSDMKTERDMLAEAIPHIERERGKLSFDLELVSQELEDVKLQSSQAAETLKTSQMEEIAKIEHRYRDRLADIERAHNDDLDMVKGELVNTEAAFYYAGLEARQPIARRLLPITLRRRRFAKIVLNSGLFDADYYFLQYHHTIPSSAKHPSQRALAAALHYIEQGFYQGYQPNALFDSSWYLRCYSDVRQAGLNPLWHYFRYGWREARDPSLGFSTKYYLESNPDVKEAGVNPLLHYIRFGLREGRRPLPKG